MPPGQSPSSNSIIVGNCIACEGLLRVSAKTNATSNVRCPHCKETFPLARLLESAVPEVEIIQSEASSTTTTTTTAQKQEKPGLYIDNTTETAKDASGKFVVPSQLAKGARRRKSSRRSDGSSRSSSRSSSRDSHRSHGDRGTSSDVSSRSSQGENHRNGSVSESEFTSRQSNEQYDGVRNDSESLSHRSTRHRDMRATEAAESEPSPVVTFLKVVAGGGLALPIAYLIVMWVFSLDPLGVGQRLGEKMPFIVPSAFRADNDVDADPKPDSEGIGIPELDDSSSSEPVDFGFGDLSIGQEALQDFDR